MGKRSSFLRRPQDAYFTPREAVRALIPHLPREPFDFIEPCAGDGRLARHVQFLTRGLGECVWQSDLEPVPGWGVNQVDAFRLDFDRVAPRAELIITNPPWTRAILHPMIERFSDARPTWLLFDSDWLYTRQSAPFLPRLRKVVAIGRVKWIEGSKSVGKDNAMWALFDRYDESRMTEFHGRVAA